MRTAARERFPTGKTLMGKLTLINRGRAAARLLAEELPQAGSIIELPRIAERDWHGTNSINVLQWSTGSTVLAVPAGDEAVAEWLMDDSKLEPLRGSLAFVPDITGHEVTGALPDAEGEAQVRVHPYHSVAHAQAILTRIERVGRDAVFELTRLLAAPVALAVEGASMRVYREIHGIDEAPGTDQEARHHVIDVHERESVTDRILWGDNGSDKGSVTLRLVERLACTDQCVKKSILAVLAINTRSIAETHVRRHIGDPHTGRVIRRLSRALQTIDPERIADEYNKMNPTQRITSFRVEAAMSAGATLDAMASPIPLDPAALAHTPESAA